MTSPRSLAVVFLILLAAAISAVWFGGGWRADAAGDPDEPAHAVTSLMIRDFLAGAEWTRPVAFAKEYYRDFPKVALGHYPPLYYVVAGLGLLVSPHIDTLLGLQALLLATLGTLVFAAAHRSLGNLPAFAAAVMTILVPLMWKISLHVMADLLLVCLCLLATLAWARYCEAPTVRRSLAFGMWAALAILTKGSGLMLAVVPPLVVIFRRDWRQLRSWSWWLAAVPVVLLAGPWMLLTAGITKEGMTGQTVGQFLGSALVHYGKTLPIQFGYFWLALALCGGLSWLGRSWRRSLDPAQASLLASFVGGVAVILLVPAGLSERYLAPIVPVFAILAVVGAYRLSRFLPQPSRPWGAVLLSAAAFCLVAKAPFKFVSGYSQAVAHVQALPAGQSPDVWLVGSDPRGEGGVIAEAAFRLKQRSPSPLRIYRAGKELGASDWMGRDYHAAFTSEHEVLAHLDKLGVHWVFVDLSVPDYARQPHEYLLQAALAGASGRWVLEHQERVTRLPWVTGDLLIYRSVARNPKP